MKVITAPDVSYAYRMGMLLLKDIGEWRETRNGRALVSPDPVTTEYQYPQRRVLFQPRRDANPFFHLFEALWMLAGRNDVAFLSQFNSRISSFSDDGVTFNGAYGHRWRKHFGYDQLDCAVSELRAVPNSRRVIVTMWDPRHDPVAASKDLPCNDMIKFELAEHFDRDAIAVSHKLNMILFNRSNDIIWGCYGANVVHMSMLHEYMAARVGVPMGRYWQISSNFHAYESEWNKRFPLDQIPDKHYVESRVQVFPLVQDPSTFDAELLTFLEHDLAGSLTAPVYYNSFFSAVAWPMFHAHRLYRGKHVNSAIGLLESCIVTHGPVDWLISAREWLLRRAAKETT